MQTFCIYLGMKETESPSRRRKGAKIYLLEYTEKYSIITVSGGKVDTYKVRELEAFTNLKKAVAHVDTLRKRIIDENKEVYKERRKNMDKKQNAWRRDMLEYAKPLDYNKVYAEIRQLMYWDSGLRDSWAVMPRKATDRKLNEFAKQYGTAHNGYYSGWCLPNAIIHTKFLH